MDLHQSRVQSRVLLTWNAIAAFSEECAAKLIHRVLLLYLVVSSALEYKSEKRAARLWLMQSLILDLNFWHRSFLTTIMSIITHSLSLHVSKITFMMI